MEKIKIIGARENNLKNVTVQIPKGKLVAFAGVSGSGKTTLLSLLKVKLGNVSNQLEQAIQNSSIEKLNTLTLSIFDITSEEDALRIIN